MTKSKWKHLVFDIETDGLLDTVTKVWCIVVEDLETGEQLEFRPHEIETKAVPLLNKAKTLVGHNIIWFDLPCLQMLFPEDFTYHDKHLVDTIVLSHLVFPNLSEKDDENRRTKAWGRLKQKGLLGSHGLKAWGIRLGDDKLDYDDWSKFTEEMLTYNKQDVSLNAKLYRMLNSRANKFPKAVELEHDVALICSEMERTGYWFDVDKANQLYKTLSKDKAKIEDKLIDTFGSFYVKNGPIKTFKKSMNRTCPVTKTKIECSAGAKYQPVKLTLFNPGSRQHIAQRMKVLFNWEPDEKTDTGLPKIDETTLGKIEHKHEEVKLLVQYLTVQKRLSALYDGKGAWLNYFNSKTHRIHGSVNTNAAVTGRATHSKPNIGQIPSIDKPYGPECRELFGVPKGQNKVQVGIDVSGLELRMLAHYLARWDGGAYGEIVCHGDPHTSNQQAAGLDTRGLAKTFIYAFLYGGGDVKIGSIAFPLASEAKQRKEGKALKKRFAERTPGLQELLKGVADACARGYLIGLDGRHLHIRSPHAALNVLLQSAGALICKAWMVLLDKEIKKRKWQDKVKQVAWVHDELQFECDKDISEEFSKVAVKAIEDTQQFFDINVPLTGEAKIGSNWKECH